MIEYLYDVIRATADEEACICAKITDLLGQPIVEDCYLMLFDDLSLLETVEGSFNGEQWEFYIPARAKGRYWYCICVHNESLCFKRAIYFI